MPTGSYPVWEGENTDSFGDLHYDGVADATPMLQEDACRLVVRKQIFGRRQKKRKMVAVTVPLTQAIEPIDVSTDTIKFEQDRDDYIKALVTFIDSDVLPADEDLAREVLLIADIFEVVFGVLYRLWKPDAKEEYTRQLVIPKKLIPLVLESTHDITLSAHLGFTKTLTKIRQRFYWKNMTTDVQNYIASCGSCSQYKNKFSKEVAPLVPLPVVGYPWERVSTDFFGPLPVTENGMKFVLCFTDHYSKWPILVPVKDESAKTVASALWERVITEHGCPRYLLSDRGAAFMSELIKEVCKLFKTTKLNTSPYHPSCNGLQERGNKVIAAMLSHYVNTGCNDWDKYLQAISFAVRSSVCDSSIGLHFSCYMVVNRCSRWRLVLFRKI